MNEHDLEKYAHLAISAIILAGGILFVADAVFGDMIRNWLSRMRGSE